MGLFSKNKPPAKPPVEVEATDKASEHDSRVEVIVHKNATKEAIDKANQVNENFKDLLVENGFTIKIWVAAGGQPPRKKQRGKAA